MVSEEKDLQYGVPQGSVLGPMPFWLCVSPLEDLIREHDCNTMDYADDTQIYVTCNSNSDVATIEACVGAVRLWMNTNFLSLNDHKSEMIHFCSKCSSRSAS